MTKPYDIPFPEFLRAWRMRSGLTQSQAAEALGESVRAYENWEQGHRKATAERYIRELVNRLDGLPPAPPAPPDKRKAKPVSAVLDSWES